MAVITNGAGDCQFVLVELPSHVSKGINVTMKKLLIAAAWLTVSTGLAFAQDLAAGATTFKKCAICHDIGEAAKNKVGPELNGIDGRSSGSATSYNYSDANKKSGITWKRQRSWNT